MRRVFLWAARNRWLKDHLPKLPFMRRAVGRFMPGETMGAALTAAEPLQAAGIGTMYTRLGENLESLAEADGIADHYIELLDAIKAAGIRGEVSVKPTQLGLDEDPDACLGPSRADRGARDGRPARISGSTWRAAPTSSRRSCSTSACARRSPRPGSASRRTSAGPATTSPG